MPPAQKQILLTHHHLYQVETQGRRTDPHLAPEALARKIPLAVVVNEFPASASEMLAATLQEAGRAKVFGTRTFGKGTTNSFRELKNGAALYLPTARWFASSGKLIEGVGVAPDEEASLTPQDVIANRDVQLQKASLYWTPFSRPSGRRQSGAS